MSKSQQYDWIDDPFDEKKNQELMRGIGKKGSRRLVALIVVVLLMFVLMVAMLYGLVLVAANLA